MGFRLTVQDLMYALVYNLLDLMPRVCFKLH
jgi:hypothetical protein